MTEWKVVPVGDPSPEMIEAGAREYDPLAREGTLGAMRAKLSCVAIYRAMVAAAPEAPAPDISTIRAQARMEALEEVAGYFDERYRAYRAAGLDIKADYADSEACAIRSLISREAPTNRAKALSDLAENDAEQIDIEAAGALASADRAK